MPLYTLPSGAGLAINALGQALSIVYPEPDPDPEPGDLVPSMVVRYLDSSGVNQSTTVLDGVTTINVTYPASIRFDCTGTRSAQLDSDDAIGAWWNIGYVLANGEGVGGTWSLSGRSKDTDRGFPLIDHTYTTAGTFEAVLTCRDSAGNQASISVNIVVAAPVVDVTLTSGVIPTWVNDTVYGAPAGGTWGNPSFSGLSNITIIKTGVGADPIFGTVTLDARNEPNESITRTRGIKFMNCDVAQVTWGNVGADNCTFVGGRVRSIVNPSMAFAGASLIVNGRTALQASNVRMPDGIFFQNTGEINEASGQYILIGEMAGLSFKNVYFRKTTSGEHNIRGIYHECVWRHCLFRNTNGSTTSWFKFQGMDCTLDTTDTGGVITGGTPDAWPSDGTMIELATPESPTATGGRLLGLPLSKVAVVDFIFGGSGDTTPTASAGMGPENNDVAIGPPPNEQFPAQGTEISGFEYGVIFPSSVTGFGFTGRGVGCRDVYLNNGAGALVSMGTGTGFNRVPSGWNGPYITTGSRPVVV